MYTYVYLCIVINPIIKLYEYFYKKKVCLLFFTVFCYYFYLYDNYSKWNISFYGEELVVSEFLVGSHIQKDY